MAEAEENGPSTRYQALYRRFRPQRFADVVGQDHVTRALRSAVRDGRVAHAYLFSGPRGTGKTSTARILAMALNCENPVDGEPDGTCASCQAIRLGASMDVQELDAASNRRIDDIRDLLGRVALGTAGRWKLYIIDEVHQLTNDASTALLKTLEEPPGHVIFVLATTDPQKVLDTIRSRTQHYEFHLLGADVLGELLEDVARRADLDLPPDAIDAVVRRGRGSARDALSALDQVAAAGATPEAAGQADGVVDALIARDPAAALVRVAEASRAGLDPRRLGNDLVEYLRNLFLTTRAPQLVMLPRDDQASARERAEALGAGALVRAMEVLGQALIDMRDSADPRVTLEVALVRLSDPEVDDSSAALLARLERLERAMAEGTPVTTAPIPPLPSPPPPRAETPTRSTTAPGAPVPPPPPPALPPQEAVPASPPARSALGAHRRANRESGASTLSPGTPSPGTPSPGTPSPGTPSPGTPSPGTPSPGTPSPGTPIPPPSQAGSEPVATSSGEQSEPPPGLPTRDELTIAWGDSILPSLRPAVKVYVASGRFLSVGADGAVYAVPDQGLLARATAGVPEVEAALRSHFGVTVRFRLVLDDDSGGPPAFDPLRPVASSPETPEDPRDYALDELEDAGSEVMSPEQRLMEAFPGAEEVTG